jgi:peptidoglycan hydrolase-like protein with peptidoglycan-binding domain
MRRYPTLRRGATGSAVTALQCVMTERGYYTGPLDGVMAGATRSAVSRARDRVGLRPGRSAGPRLWTALLTPPRDRVIKFGAASERVRALQRALNAATGADLVVDGIFGSATTTAVKTYQAEQGSPVSGVATAALWGMLRAGKV